MSNGNQHLAMATGERGADGEQYPGETKDHGNRKQFAELFHMDQD